MLQRADAEKTQYSLVGKVGQGIYPQVLDYTPKSTTNYSKLLTLLIRVGGVFRHLAIPSSWLEPVLFDIILTSSSSLHSPPLEKDVVLNMNG